MKKAQFNISNLNHPTQQVKIYAALQRARVGSLKRSDGYFTTYVKNSQGNNYLRVTFDRTQKQAIRFYGKNSGEITNKVLTALKA